MHPVQLVFEHLTKVVAHAMGEPSQSEKACTCCGRPASEYGGFAYSIVDHYGVSQLHCPACQSFNVGDKDIMGIERFNRGNQEAPVSHKFGMMSGVGWVFCLETKQSHLLAPPGVAEKIPESTKKLLNLVEITQAGHLPFILELGWPYPLLYISSFGKKTKDLINSLSISHSSSALVCCSDDGIDATNRVFHTIDIEIAVELSKRIAELSKADGTLFNNVITSLANGRMTPSDASAALKDNQTVIDLIRLCTVDPHQRLALLRLVRKL